MNLKYSKEWYAKRIDLEGESEVGAGLPGRPDNSDKVTFVDTRIALGAFVSLWRRNQCLDARPRCGKNPAICGAFGVGSRIEST